MFFSTPHRGSDYADLGLLAANVAMAMGMDANDTNLRNLKPNSELPSLLLKDFAQILSKNRIYIDTFLEAQGFSGYGPLRGKVGYLLFERALADFLQDCRGRLCTAWLWQGA